MQKIYILKKGKLLVGPFTIEQVKEKGLRTSDRIWYEGNKEWLMPDILAYAGIPIVDDSDEERKKLFKLFTQK